MLPQKVKALSAPALIGLVFTSLVSMAESLPPPVEEPPYKRQQQLSQLLLQDCSVCHDKLMKGNLGPPLTREALADKSESALANSIMRGHDNTEMPAWAWKLEDYEARWLARYLRTGRLNSK